MKSPETGEETGLRGLQQMEGVVSCELRRTRAYHTLIRVRGQQSHGSVHSLPFRTSLDIGLIRDVFRLRDSAGAVRNRYCKAMRWLRSAYKAVQDLEIQALGSALLNDSPVSI